MSTKCQCSIFGRNYELINLVNPECDTRRKGKVVISKNDMEVIM